MPFISINKTKQLYSKLSVTGQFEVMSGFFIIKFFNEGHNKDSLQNTNLSLTVRSLIRLLKGNFQVGMSLNTSH